MVEEAVNLEHVSRRHEPEIWTENTNIEETLPAELPTSKDHHLIFCYSSTVAPEVRSIVNGVEARGLKCCFYERDFITGKTIVKNIEDMMKSAQGVVFILTEDFINSRYFPIESEHALELKESNILHHVIPVRLDICQIPMQLKHITCVDLSNRSYEEAAREIFDTFVKLDNDHHKSTATIGGEIAGQALRTVRPKFSTTKDILVLSEGFRNDLQTKHIQIPTSVLETAQTLINKSLLVEKRKAVEKTRWPLCVFFISSVVLLFALFCVVTAATNKQTPYFFWPFYVILTYAVALSVLMLIHFCCRCTEKLTLLATQNMKRVLWRRINRSLLQDHHAIVIYQQGVFIAMRLNIKPCKETFLRKIRGRPTFFNFDEQFETEEEFTNRMFDGWLSEHYHELIQPNPMRGSTHLMANYATCPCTCVQEYARTSAHKY